MKSTIVILNWNNAQDTLECLDSLKKLSAPCEILLVDNGSTDDSVERIRTAYPSLPIIENGQNLGYAAGNNRGIEAALANGAELIVLLNNDTIVATHFLEALQTAAIDHPTAGAFGAKIYFYDEPATLWHAGGDVDRKKLRCYHIGCGDADSDKQHENVRPIGYACGCAIALRAEALRQVGLLDPAYFLLWEEIDLCWRLKKYGWECLFVPKARVWHKISASFPEGNRGPFWQYHYFRSRLLFLKRHFSHKERLLFYLQRLPRESIALLSQALNLSISRDLRRESSAALKGIFSYFLK